MPRLSLLPRDRTFFDLFGKAGQNALQAARLLAQMMQRAHVDLVDVGPLLAIDLDADEQLVHHVGNASVLETLVRHDVTPVARGIADG